MNMKSRTLDRLREAMKDKTYRDAFVEEHIRTGIPFQIRALREKAKWKQKELGQRANMAQERISVLEDPDYSKFTISTLLKLASAFDVGLTVRFVPFSKVLKEEANLSDTLAPACFSDDEYFFRDGIDQSVVFSIANTPGDICALTALLGGVENEEIGTTKQAVVYQESSMSGFILAA